MIAVDWLFLFRPWIELFVVIALLVLFVWMLK